jgi:hypothetical protein
MSLIREAMAKVFEDFNAGDERNERDKGDERDVGDVGVIDRYKDVLGMQKVMEKICY